MDEDERDISDEEFDRQRKERYKRLSLLTLTLAEEAGEAAVNWSMVDLGPRPGQFERRIGAMSRAIWAHQIIERLRLGRAAAGPIAPAPRLRDRAPEEIGDHAASPSFAPGFSLSGGGSFDEKIAASDAAPPAPQGGDLDFDDDAPPGDAINNELNDDIDEDALNAAVEEALRAENVDIEMLKAAISGEDQPRGGELTSKPRAPP